MIEPLLIINLFYQNLDQTNQSNQMKSLRTDDIIGATPTVRHMPKNLLRQHKYYPYQTNTNNNNQRNLLQTQKDYENYYNNLGGKWDHSFNSNMYGNFPLSQYDPNPFIKDTSMNRSRYNLVNNQDNNNINNTNNNINNPIINDNDKNKEFNSSRMSNSNKNPQYTSNNNQKSFDNLKYQLPKYTSRQSSRGRNGYNNQFIDNDRRESSMVIDHLSPKQLIDRRDIKRKQDVLINYSQVMQLEKMRAEQNPQNGFNNLQSNRYSSPDQPHLPNKYNTKQSKIINSSSSLQVQTPQNNPQRVSSSMNRSVSSKKQSQTSNNKNIFRGLGFNIITNSKYEFNLQTSNPYIKKSLYD